MAKYVSLNNLTKYDGNIKEYIRENAQSIQRNTMPVASEDNLGDIVQYTGTTGGDYINGYFYKCISDEAATPTYSWINIEVNPQLETATPSEVDTITDIYDEDYVFLLASTLSWENNPYCFVWHKDEPTSAYKPWYGEAMTLTDLTYDGKKIYKYAIPADGPYGEYNMCIFTQDGQNQTADLDVQKGKVYNPSTNTWLDIRTKPLAENKIISIEGLNEYNIKMKEYVDSIVLDTLGGSY